MNNVRRGYYRDSQIVEMVRECGVLSSEQIAALIFGEMKSGIRKAQERLLKLSKSKELLRSKLRHGYVYHVERLGGRTEHRLETNWALVWLLTRQAEWERVVAWEYEPDYGYMRPDLLFATENRVTKQYRVVHVELDRSTRNAWGKVALYTKLYRDEGYRGHWWVDKANKFPLVLCVTQNDARARSIREIVERENVCGLRFDVRVLQDIKKEAMPWDSC